MNYSEIIKSIIDTKNVSVEELAYFTATSKKKVNKWLSGEAEPKKRNIKLLASFCGVTEALLKEGIISPIQLSKIDENGESHEPTLTEIEENNLRLQKAFFKKRFFYEKITNQVIFFGTIIFSIILFAMSIVSAMDIIFINDTKFFATLCLGVFAPILLTFLQISLNKPFSKNFYLYSSSIFAKIITPSVIAILLNSIVPYILGFLHISVLLFSIASVITAVIIANALAKKKFEFKRRRTNEVLLAIPAYLMFITTLCPPPQSNLTETPLPFASLAIIFTLIHTFYLCGIYYETTHTKKYFSPLPENKKYSKKRVIISTVVTVLVIAMLSTTLFFTNKYASRVLIEYFNSIVKNPIVETNNPIPTDFNNYDVVFENEKVKTLDFEAFTIKIPEEYIEQKNEYEYSCILKTKNSTILIMLPNYDISDPKYSDLYNLTKMAMKNAESEEDIEKIKKTENALIEQFGFVPTSHIDYERFYKILNENKDFALTRELSSGITLFYSMFTIYSIGNYSEFKEIYSNNDFEGLFYQAHKEEGFVSYTFQFGVPQKSDTAYGFSINFENTEPDMELIYKIMNSIEFK